MICSPWCWPTSISPTLPPLYQEAARLCARAAGFVIVGYHPHFLMLGIPTHFDRADGQPVAIESHVHLLSDHVKAAHASGWRLLEMDEGVVDEAWLAKKPKWRQYAGHPVSFAMVWQRTAAEGVSDGRGRPGCSTRREIAARVEALADEIIAAVGSDLVVVGVLKGSFVFLADLVRALCRAGAAPRVEFMRLASYGQSMRARARSCCSATCRATSRASPCCWSTTSSTPACRWTTAGAC